MLSETEAHFLKNIINSFRRLNFFKNLVLYNDYSFIFRKIQKYYKNKKLVRNPLRAFYLFEKRKLYLFSSGIKYIKFYVFTSGINC